VNARRRLVVAAVAVVSMGAVLAVVLAVTGSSQVADGDPHRVTVGQLRDRLERSGLQIRTIREPTRSIPTIVGVASAGHAAIGFEFQVFPASDVATVRKLGRLRSTDFGWPPARFNPLYRTWIRGVLGNVAYAQYEIETDGQLLAESARRRIVQMLDDALFSSFSPDDPYAHALRDP